MHTKNHVTLTSDLDIQ